MVSDLSGDPFARPSPTEDPVVDASVEAATSREAGPASVSTRSWWRSWSDGISGRPHTPERALRWSLVVAALLGAAYWFTQWPLPRLLRANPSYNFYLVQPVIWGGIACLAFYGWLRLEDRPRFSRLLVGISFLVGIFHVAILVIAGVIWTFGDSPSAGRLVNYPKNLFFIGTLLVGAEVSRAYLYHVWRRWNERLAFAGVTALIFAIGMAAAQWTPFDSLDYGLRVVGGRWLPALALSILCTWLVSYGGLGPSFAYRFALVAFEWFSPILPNLAWLVLLVIGISVPFVSSWLVLGIYGDTREGEARTPAPEEEEPEKAPRPRWVRWTGLGATAVLIAGIVLFMTGAFGYHLSVVDGASMEPSFSKGDMLIVREGVDPASLRVNDVIQFQQGNLPVVHRIVAVEEGAGGLVFTTKGDAVESLDQAITPDQIKGKVVFAIPLVGYPNLWFRGG